MAERKVLISPGFGAGWMTWNQKYAEDFLFDAELIAAVEAGEDLGNEDDEGTPLHAFEQRLVAKHGADAEGDCYFGGARDLEVVTVTGRFRVEEYDGSETLVEDHEQEWY